MYTFGKYRLEEKIGSGRFGDVYRGVDTMLEREIAVKVLKPEWTNDTEFVLQFQNEARLAAKISHPNVVMIYDVGEVEGRFLIAMEYLPGGSLADRIERARDAGLSGLEVDEAVHLLEEMALGLAGLHKRQVVHCDLKPSNVLLDRNGHAKIGDLGLAISFNTSKTTRTSISAGHSAGTPAYMSPEQEGSVPFLRPPSDIYSLGLILYEMLTLRNYKLEPDGTRLCDVRPDAPAWLDELLEKMLVFDWKKRLWDGEKVVEAIRAGQAASAVLAEANEPDRDFDSQPGGAEPVDVETPNTDPNQEQTKVRARLPWRVFVIGGISLLVLICLLASRMLTGSAQEDDFRSSSSSSVLLTPNNPSIKTLARPTAIPAVRTRTSASTGALSSTAPRASSSTTRLKATQALSRADDEEPLYYPLPNCHASHVHVGDWVMISLGGSANAVRNEASTVHKESIIGYAKQGELIQIIDGPVCDINKSYLLWKVRTNTDDVVTGWTPETNGKDFYFTRLPSEKVCSNAPASIVQAGEKAMVTRYPNTASRVRAGAGVNYDVVFQVSPGTVVDVMDGPKCSDGYVWWKIRTPGGDAGWMAEGNASTHYLVPNEAR